MSYPPNNLPRRPHEVGDEWVFGPDGEKFWGRFGAAGLLAWHREAGVMLQLRATWSHYGDTWGLPGGHLELRERMVDCAARELMEETGMTAAEFIFNGVVNGANDANPVHYIHINFIAKNPQGEPVIKEPHKCLEWKWFAFRELPADIYPPHARQIELFISTKSNFADN